MKLILLLALFVSCASKPKLYPNEKLKAVGNQIAQKDVDQCIEDAEKYLESSKGKQVAKGVGAGAAIGAAIGVVGGFFTGDIGGSIARGGAMGAAGGGVAGALTPDQIKQRYVNQCLADQQYLVIGWD
jgi:outer membrane lipoprotein SlyB